MSEYKDVAAFNLDLTIAGQERAIPRAAIIGQRLRVKAALISGSWGSATIGVKYRIGMAAPANFATTLTLSASPDSVGIEMPSEVVFDELCIVQSGTSSGALIRIIVSEEVFDGSGGPTTVIGAVTDGDKGDITLSANATTFTIDNDSVTYAKMQNVSATDKVLGRSTAGAGDVEEIACTAAGRALIDDADASAQRATLGVGSLLSVQTGGTTVTNPGAGVETDLSLTYTLPANFWTVGKAVWVTQDIEAAGGTLNTTTMKLKAGSVVLSTTGAISAGSATVTQWAFRHLVVCTATGASGTLLISTIGNSRNGNAIGSMIQQTATVDTTGTLILKNSVTFGATVGTVSAKQSLLMVEQLN